MNFATKRTWKDVANAATFFYLTQRLYWISNVRFTNSFSFIFKSVFLIWKLIVTSVTHTVPSVPAFYVGKFDFRARLDVSVH